MSSRKYAGFRGRQPRGISGKTGRIETVLVTQTALHARGAAGSRHVSGGASESLTSAAKQRWRSSGPDMFVFPSARDCAARAGLCPGNNESAGAVQSINPARQPDPARGPHRMRARGPSGPGAAVMPSGAAAATSALSSRQPTKCCARSMPYCATARRTPIPESTTRRSRSTARPAAGRRSSSSMDTSMHSKDPGSAEAPESPNTPEPGVARRLHRQP